MSESHKGEKNYLYGGKHTEDWKEKVRAKRAVRRRVFFPDKPGSIWIDKDSLEEYLSKGYTLKSNMANIHKSGEVKKVC